MFKAMQGLNMKDSSLLKAFESARLLAEKGTFFDGVMPLPRIPHPAELTSEHVLDQIVEFEEGLDMNHEVGLHLVQAGTMTVIHVERVGYLGTDLVTFDGRDTDGNRVRIVQHHSQVSVAFKALPKLSETPIRIGFLAST
jgi:hypothetical protein